MSQGARVLALCFLATGALSAFAACSSSDDTTNTAEGDDDDDSKPSDDDDDEPSVPGLDGAIDALTTADGAPVCVAEGGCAFDATSTPNAIQCGEALCMDGKICCGGLCVGAADTCEAAKERKGCDEPADCAGGQACCASDNGMSVLGTACGGCTNPKDQVPNFAVCRNDADCKAVFKTATAHCVVIDPERTRSYGRCAE